MKKVTFDNSAKDRNAPLIAQVPVILAEKEIDFTIESIIQLPQSAIEILRTKKTPYISSAKLLPIRPLSALSNDRSFNLTIEGYIKEIIEFAAIEKTEAVSIEGIVKCILLYTPFKYTAEINSLTTLEPFKDAKANHPLLISYSPALGEEYEIQKKDGFSSNYEFDIKYHSPVFCELEKAEIFETNRYLDKGYLNTQLPIEYSFKKLDRKLYIALLIKLLQKQQIQL